MNGFLDVKHSTAMKIAVSLGVENLQILGIVVVALPIPVMNVIIGYDTGDNSML